jgi:hypothetical protein
MRAVSNGAAASPQNALSKQIWDYWLLWWKNGVIGGTQPTAWSVVVHASQNSIIVNLPVNLIGGDTYQWVMNLQTNVWSRFLNWDALHFAVFNGKLYYGADNNGYIIKCWEGSSDWYAATTIGLQSSVTQVGMSLAGSKEFQVALVRPRMSGYASVSLSFMGNSSNVSTRWFSPANRAQNQIPILFLPTMDIDSVGALTWYGTDVKFRVTPGQ